MYHIFIYVYRNKKVSISQVSSFQQGNKTDPRFPLVFSESVPKSMFLWHLSHPCLKVPFNVSIIRQMLQSKKFKLTKLTELLTINSNSEYSISTCLADLEKMLLWKSNVHSQKTFRNSSITTHDKEYIQNEVCLGTMLPSCWRIRFVMTVNRTCNCYTQSPSRRLCPLQQLMSHPATAVHNNQQPTV